MSSINIKLIPANKELENSSMIQEIFYHLYHIRLSSITEGGEEIKLTHTIKIDDVNGVNMYKFIVRDLDGFHPVFNLIHTIENGGKQVHNIVYTVRIEDKD